MIVPKICLNLIISKDLYIMIIMIFDWNKIFKKISYPDYENDLGDKYFFRV